MIHHSMTLLWPTNLWVGNHNLIWLGALLSTRISKDDLFHQLVTEFQQFDLISFQFG
jgi:hypothetical protein